MQVCISHVGREGDGLATIDGQRVAVPFALPDEVIDVALHPQQQVAVVERIITASPARVTPPCPYFGVCGNCRMQHAKEDFYVAWKKNLIELALQKNGIEKKVDDFFITPYASRRRTRWVVEKKEGSFYFGYHTWRSHDMVDIQTCHVLDKNLAGFIAPLRALFAQLLEDGQKISIHATSLNGQVELVLTGAPLLPQQTEALCKWGEGQPKLARLLWQ